MYKKYTECTSDFWETANELVRNEFSGSRILQKSHMRQYYWPWCAQNHLEGLVSVPARTTCTGFDCLLCGFDSVLSTAI